MFGIATGTEEYNTIKMLTKDFAAYVNSIRFGDHWRVDLENGVMQEIDFYFVSDMKFMLLAMGHPAAQGNHTCLFCYACKHHRGKYNYSFGLRDFEKILQLGKEGHNRLPLIPLPTDHLLVDELHFVLRIGETLLARLVKMATKDCKVSANALKKAFQEARIRLNWSPSDEARDGIRVHSLKKQQHLLWMTNLNMAKIFEGETLDHWNKAINTFLHLYHSMTTERPPAPSYLEQVARGFLKSLLSTFKFGGSTISLFKEHEITPYLHVVVHIPEMVKQVGSLANYSCSSLERRNLRHDSMVFSQTQRGRNMHKQVLQQETTMKGIEKKFEGLGKSLVRAKMLKPREVNDQPVAARKDLSKPQLVVLEKRLLVPDPPLLMCSECQSAIFKYRDTKPDGESDPFVQLELKLMQEYDDLHVDLLDLLLESDNSGKDLKEDELAYLSQFASIEGDESGSDLDDTLRLQTYPERARPTDLEVKQCYDREKEEKKRIAKENREKAKARRALQKQAAEVKQQTNGSTQQPQQLQQPQQPKPKQIQQPQPQSQSQQHPQRSTRSNRKRKQT